MLPILASPKHFAPGIRLLTLPQMKIGRIMRDVVFTEIALAPTFRPRETQDRFFYGLPIKRHVCESAVGEAKWANELKKRMPDFVFRLETGGALYEIHKLIAHLDIGLVAVPPVKRTAQRIT